MGIFLYVVLFIVGIYVIFKFIIPLIFKVLGFIFGIILHFIWLNIKCIPLYIIAALINPILMIGVVVLSLILTIKWLVSGHVKSYSFLDMEEREFVLNKRSGVIRHWWDSSINDISEHNRKIISADKGWELIAKNDKYHFKR